MFLHLGADMVVATKDIIGVFDLDTSTVAEDTRNFLTDAEKSLKVINVTYNLPKAFVLTDNANNSRTPSEARIYISQLSPQTLLKRSREKLDINE
ncbi:MAG: DUF370 domain-containing protein [Clostridiales bacterium]|jgi:CDP-diacylglycerol pyrophosphatase|nr:DUF370 domain-containing protein [Clostridiales bacterium]